MTGSRSAVVVAHPDDESLWLSAVVGSVDQVVFCFGDLFDRPRPSAARRRAVAALPFANLVDLSLPESGAGFSVDWEHPCPTASGIAITDDAARDRYEANFPRLVEALHGALAGCSEIYTHNPWGEYGHAEHVQIHRAVAALQAELGYMLWFSNYVGRASWPLARLVGESPCWSRRRVVEPDRDLAHKLMRIYRSHGAWTWSRWHRWPSEEILYGQPPAGDGEAWHSLCGEWLRDIAGLRPWPTPWVEARRHLG